MTAILTTVLTVLAELAGSAKSASTVARIIAMLVDLVPLLRKEWTALYTPIKNIIANLRGTAGTSEEQLKQLDALEVDVDAAFEKEAERALAEDEAADMTGGDGGKPADTET